MAGVSELVTDLRDGMLVDPGLPRSNSTEAYWQLPRHVLSRTQSQLLPTSVDVAIIGSGMTGVAVAKTLLESNTTLRVGVLEARELCSGATGRNGGHLAPNAILEHSKLVQQFGIDQANKIAAYQLLNCERVRAIAAEFCPEESEIRNVRSLCVFADRKSLEDQIHTLKEYAKNNPKIPNDFEILSTDNVTKNHGIQGSAGAVLSSSGAMWPYRLVTKVWETLMQRYPERLSIETLTPVTAILHRSEAGLRHPYRIVTPRGEIDASNIIHCTNGYASHLVPNLRGRLWPCRGTMSVQALSPAIPNQGAKRSWAMLKQARYDGCTGLIDTGLLYLTQNPKTGYFFFGGERAKPIDLFNSDDTQVTQTSLEYLQQSLLETFVPGSQSNQIPEQQLISAWSGIMGFTGDELPLVGQLSKTWTARTGEGEFIAAGFNGHGMAVCWLAGETIARLALEKSKPEFFPEAFMLSDCRMETMDPATSAKELAAIISHNALANL